MKKITFAVGFLFFNLLAHADLFTDLLQVKEPKPDKIYYQILPEINADNPDIFFIRSREPQNFSLEDNYLKMIKNATDAVNFIETGTYLGQTTKKAANYFSKIQTIELSKELFEKTKKSLSNTKNITFHWGDSTEILPSIIKTIKNKSVFFLDAHFSLADTVKGENNTPILKELDLLKKSTRNDLIIIIDDIRMFYRPLIELKNNFMEGYPTLNTIVEKILEINETYQIAIVFDTLIAFPAKEKISISPVVHAITMSRLYDGKNYLIEDVIRAELCIAQAKDNEKDAILELGQRWVEPFSQQVGLSAHYALWHGLILLQHDQYKIARESIFEAKKRGLRDWRIDWYLTMAEIECFFDIR